MVKICRTCGQSFYVKASHAAKRFNCSRACMTAEYRERMRGEANPNFRNATYRVCVRCGADYVSYDKRRQYCSMACAHQAPETIAKMLRSRRERQIYPRADAHYVQARLPDPRPPRLPKARPSTVPRTYEPPSREAPHRTCVACGTTFRSARGRRYCDACGIETRICGGCQQPFTVRVYSTDRTCGAKACQRIRRSEWQKGEKSHRWQGGKTSAGVLRRTSFQYDDWRRHVFSGDDYTCQLCGQVGGRLAAHHIKRVARYPDLIYEPWNGISLCWPCHRSIKGKEEAYEARFLAYTQSRV